MPIIRATKALRVVDYNTLIDSPAWPLAVGAAATKLQKEVRSSRGAHAQRSSEELDDFGWRLCAAGAAL